MTTRALRLPDDLLPLSDMLVRTFQYPDNPEWSVQADEEEDIAREIRSLRRLWPALRLGQVISKPLRDLFRGFVWTEGSRVGGVVIAQRRGATDMWTIGTVGVLPEFRRRGLARQLLTETLEDIRRRGGTHIVLAVIDKNVPAYSLYRSLGFVHYSSQTEYCRTPGSQRLLPVAVPSSYDTHGMHRFDWQVRYELARRITPAEVASFEPISPSRYRPPAAIRLLAPLLDAAQKRVERRLVVTLDGLVVAHGGCRTTRTSGGTSSVWVELDPSHPHLALPLVGTLSASVAALSPARRIQFSAAAWMPTLSEAAETLGFTRRMQYHWLGLAL